MVRKMTFDLVFFFFHHFAEKQRSGLRIPNLRTKFFWCRARKGFFENLEQRIALGYGLKQPVSDLVQIFQLSDREKKKIQSLHFTMKGKDAPSMDDKYRRAIHYLWETAYGLCLSSSYNISSNPGWEQALKQYVGKSK